MRQLFILITAMIVVFTATACNNEKPTAANPGNGQPPASSNQAATPAPNGSPSTGTAPVTTPGLTEPAKAESNKNAPPVVAPQGAKEQPVATEAQYDKVDFGMSYDEVSKVMGQLGKMTSESKDEDGRNAVQTYEYKTKEGGTLKITFKDGKMLNKSSSSK